MTMTPLEHAKAMLGAAEAKATVASTIGLSPRQRALLLAERDYWQAKIKELEDGEA